MERFIQKAKDLRKQRMIDRSWRLGYAFVGVGRHSLGNLYPVIDYLRVPVKYIVTKSEKSATKVGENFRGITGTANLDTVLNDPGIHAVFICATPQSHAELINKCLRHGKHVWVEKPPCTQLTELKTLIETRQVAELHCQVGLQKVFAPVYRKLKSHCQSPISYHYEYHVGAYPEGDLLTELFIHPLHLLNYLFGESTLESVTTTSSSKGAASYFLQVRHGDLVGSVELSSEYSWSGAREELSVNAANGVYRTRDCDELTFSAKRAHVLGVPLEKITAKNSTQEFLVKRNGLVPTVENSLHYLHGYFGEISAFVEQVEGGGESPENSLESLLSTYLTIDQLRS